MATPMSLIRKLRSPNNRQVLEAIEELRARGWLEEGVLMGIPLLHVHFEGADLFNANLRGVDFHQAHLQGCNLARADLTGAKLTRADLRGADFSKAVLKEADLYKADLREARNLTDEQLAETKRLWGATMPDGSVYDGRYNLNGDLQFARWARVDVNDPEAMAYYLGVSLDAYLRGQEAAKRLKAQEMQGHEAP